MDKYTGWLKKVSCCTVSTAYFFEPPCIYACPHLGQSYVHSSACFDALEISSSVFITGKDEDTHIFQIASPRNFQKLANFKRHQTA